VTRLFRRPDLVVYAGGRAWRRVTSPPIPHRFISCRTFFSSLVLCHTGKTAQCKRNNHSNIFTLESGRYWL